MTRMSFTFLEHLADAFVQHALMVVAANQQPSNS